MNSFAPAQPLSALPFARTKTSADDLYPQVFDAILEQRLVPSSRFTEESLADLFGTSRSSIRQVLTRLSHQQIIIVRPNHRPKVAALDAEQTRQTLHARRLTEITLVRLACQQPCPQDLQRLRVLIEQERQCTQRGPAIRLAGEFHLQLAEMAGNAPLAHFLGSLVPMTALAIARFGGQTQSCCEWQAHAGIVDALEGGDVAMAVRLMGQCLDQIEGALLNPETCQDCIAN
ncbi:GntR family transcriptional regulator [Pseudomonas sp. N3-W]|uniref:GntR family transcriptional regulator n=1 Tax=Pseudomonas fungipugnans TaxID=3024217 RepID=A0ABT6QMS8_9PSED|nr:MULTISPECIES: GntR family transcriptional regulator [unclassified Pseudomonas]MDI2592095.1 GntR family transcriptional regulator [Pseudomonas sp. 681]UWF48582.1 GntR family transcriptional regulator [Pseudomonas sp. N3-W]